MGKTPLNCGTKQPEQYACEVAISPPHLESKLENPTALTKT